MEARLQFDAGFFVDGPVETRPELPQVLELRYE
jgi:hypothetical protein